jgi:hypothetical protein
MHLVIANAPDRERRVTMVSNEITLYYPDGRWRMKIIVGEETEFKFNNEGIEIPSQFDFFITAKEPSGVRDASHKKDPYEYKKTGENRYYVISDGDDGYWELKYFDIFPPSEAYRIYFTDILIDNFCNFKYNNSPLVWAQLITRSQNGLSAMHE